MPSTSLAGTRSSAHGTKSAAIRHGGKLISASRTSRKKTAALRSLSTSLAAASTMSIRMRNFVSRPKPRKLGPQGTQALGSQSLRALQSCPTLMWVSIRSAHYHQQRGSEFKMKLKSLPTVARICLPDGRQWASLTKRSLSLERDQQRRHRRQDLSNMAKWSQRLQLSHFSTRSRIS